MNSSTHTEQRDRICDGGHSYAWEDGVNTGKTPGGGGARGQMGWGPETNLGYERWAQEALGCTPSGCS
jgi:hypothetical protein